MWYSPLVPPCVQLWVSPNEAADSAEEWDLHLVAYLSLVAEDIGRITAGNVTERIKVLRFMQRILGISFTRSVIVPAADLYSNNLPMKAPLSLDPSALTTMVTAQGPCIGVQIPWDLARSSFPTFQRPAGADGVRFLGSRDLLASSTEADRIFMQTRFNTALPAASAAASPAQDSGAGLCQIVKPSDAPARDEFSRLDAKMSSLTLSVKHLLAPAATDWESIRESRFTPLISKVAALHHEATDSGDGTTMEACIKLLHGLQAGKMVMRCQRELLRSKDQHAKIVEYGTHFMNYIPFLESNQVAVPLSLRLHHMKVIFHTVVQQHRKISKGLKAILDQGFGVSCCDESQAPGNAWSGGRLSHTVWLRALMFRCLTEELKSGNLEETAVFADCMHNDIAEAHDILMADATMRTKCQELAEDLVHIRSIFAAAQEPCSVRHVEVQAGVNKLDLPHMAPLKHALMSSDIGRDIVAKGQVLLQMSAKDAVAERKLNRALEIMQDSKMPRLRPASEQGSTPGAVELDIALIRDMSVVELMDECIVLATEALTLWTTTRRDERTEDLIKLFEAVFDEALFVDEALTVITDAVVRAACGDWLLVPSSEPPEAKLAPTYTKANLDNLRKAMDNHLVRDDRLTEFSERLQSIVDGMGESGLQAKLLRSTMYSTLSQQIARNVEVRGSAIRVLESILSLGELQASPEDAVDEWLGKRADGKASESIINKLVSHALEVQALTSTAYMQRQAEWCEVVHIVCADGGIMDGLVGSLSRAQGLPNILVALSLNPFVSHFLKQSVQVICDRFATTLPQLGVRFPVLPEDLSSSSAGDLAQAFFDKAAMGDHIAEVGRVFGTAGRKDHDWQSNAVLELFGQLASTLPRGCFELHLKSFGKYQSDSDIDSWHDSDEASKAFDLMARMSRVTMCFAFLQGKLVQESEAVRDNQLKPEVEQVATVARTTINQTLKLFKDRHYGDTARWASIPFHLPIAQGRQWFEGASSVVVTMCMRLIGFSVKACDRLAAELTTHIPKYSHIVTDDHFNEKLARRQLLEWPSREALCQVSTSLFHSIAGVSRLHTTWNITPALAEITDFASIADNQNTFAAARKSLVVIAAVSLVLEVGDAGRQHQQAQHLLAKNGDDLPRSLKARVAKMRGTT